MASLRISIGACLALASTFAEALVASSPYNSQRLQLAHVKRAGNFQSYTAIGDSWSAGNGPYGKVDTSPETATCERTTGSYPSQFKQTSLSSDAQFQFVACSGATTEDILQQILSDAFGKPDLVTLTAGGNNNGMSTKTLGECAVNITEGYEERCAQQLEDDKQTIAELDAQLLPVLQAAKTHSLPDNATGAERTVVLLGYAQPFNALGSAADCPLVLDRAEQLLGAGKEFDKVNQVLRSANAALARIAAANNVIFADIDSAFEGHRLCDAGGEAWIQADFDITAVFTGTATGDSPGHPTQEGYAAMADALARSLGLAK